MTDQPNSSIRLTVRNEHSIPSSILGHVIKPFKPHLVSGAKDVGDGSPRLPIPSRIKTKCSVTERNTEDIWHYVLTPKQKDTPQASAHHRILYFAGGGFRQRPSPEHWRFCAAMATQLTDGINIEVVSYPLAPHCPAPKALPPMRRFMQTVLEEAKEQDQRVTLMGDSAGGNIALMLGLEIAREMAEKGQESLLKSVMVVSPAVDLRNINPEMKKAEKDDVILTFGLVEEVAIGWADSISRDDPQVSPIMSDVTPFVKAGVMVDGVIGTADILSPDAILYREKLAKEGVSGDWLEWKKQMHCFPLAFAPGMKESQAAFAWIQDVLNRRCVRK